jgi:hypothetical protein
VISASLVGYAATSSSVRSVSRADTICLSSSAFSTASATTCSTTRCSTSHRATASGSASARTPSITCSASGVASTPPAPRGSRGERDRLVPARIAEEWQRVLRGAQLVLWPCGHVPMWEVPNELAACLLAFLKQQLSDDSGDEIGPGVVDGVRLARDHHEPSAG